MSYTASSLFASPYASGSANFKFGKQELKNPFAKFNSLNQASSKSSNKAIYRQKKPQPLTFKMVRRYAKKSRYSRKKKSYRSALRAMAGVRRHGYRNRTELKLQDVDVVGSAGSPSTVNDTGAVVTCISIGEGTGSDQRIGNKVFLKSIQLNMDGYIQGSNDSVLRVIVFKDKQNPTGTTPAYTDVMKNANVYSLKKGDPISLSRFTIIRDFTFSFRAQSEEEFHTKIFVKCNGSTLVFPDGSSTPASGNYYLAVLGNQSVTTSRPQLRVVARTRFYD